MARRAPNGIPAREWKNPRPLLSYVEVDPGHVALYAPEIPTLLVARLRDGYPVRAGGYGGWEEIARPGQTSATVFRGAGPLTLSLPLTLGGWPDDPLTGGIPGRRQVEVLDQMARQPSTADRGDRPPLITVKGAVPHGGVRWFVDDLQWDENGRVEPDPKGRLLLRRIGVTVVLKQHVPVEFATIRPRKSSGSKMRGYRVKRGETPGRIAQRECGASPRETAATVRRFQWGRAGRGRRRGDRIRDPRRIRAGDLILIPRKKGRR